MQKINYIIIARRAKRQSNNGVPIVRRLRLDSMRYMLQLILIADSFRVLLHLKSAINAIKTKLQTETACSDGLVLFCYNLNRSSWSLWMLTMVTWRILFFLSSMPHYSLPFSLSCYKVLVSSVQFLLFAVFFWSIIHDGCIDNADKKNIATTTSGERQSEKYTLTEKC